MHINEVKKEQALALLKKPNVNFVGIGFKSVKGKQTKEICLSIGVTKKVKKGSLRKQDIVPQQIDSVPTDVVESGVIRALAKKKVTKTEPKKEEKTEEVATA